MYRLSNHGRGVDIQEGVRFNGIENLVLGDDVVIGADCYIQAVGGVTIKNSTIIGLGVKIWSVNHRYADSAVPVNA
jgi:acetyltransferase-like isoleucine patch superfamily enzyme